MTPSAKAPQFWLDNLILGAATAATGGLAFLFYSVLAHALGPRDYGTLAALTNMLGLLLIPGPIVTLVYTRLGRPPGMLWGPAGLLAGGVAAFSLTTVLRSPLARFFHLPAPLWPLFGLALVPQFLLAANLGRLQRARRYPAVGVLVVANQASQVLAAWISVRLAHGLHALTILALLGALAAALTWAFSVVLVMPVPPDPALSRLPLFWGTLLAGALTGGYGAADSLLAKARLPASAAGRMNGLATVTHALPDATAALATVLLTSMIAAPESGRRYLLATVGLFLAMCGVALALFTFAGPAIVTVLLGSAFRSTLPFLIPYGIAMALESAILLGIIAAVAKGRFFLLRLPFLGFVLWLAILWNAHTVAGFVGRTLPVLALTSGLLLAEAALLLTRRPPPAVRWTQPRTVRRTAGGRAPLARAVPGGGPGRRFVLRSRRRSGRRPGSSRGGGRWPPPSAPRKDG